MKNLKKKSFNKLPKHIFCLFSEKNTHTYSVLTEKEIVRLEELVFYYIWKKNTFFREKKSGPG